MPTSDALSIGDFSLMTHLSIKTLRYYHQVGLLEPAAVDPQTGYRSYRVEQIPTAHIIQRFRELTMPVDEVKAVLAAPDINTRNALIAAHLHRLEGELEHTRQTVMSLRNLLQPTASPLLVEHRTVLATPSVAIQAEVDLADLALWYHGALGELSATIAMQGMQPAGPAGGLFSTTLFHYERGEATVFVPIAGTIKTVGRVVSLVVPAVELAVTLHTGSHASMSQTYAALGVYVAKHALAIVGPVREYYLVDERTTSDPNQWRTEIGWPIFQTLGQ
jgi:DNA-binding transcriptional MerR regulator/effector-binding domain-containing protein